MRRPARAHVMAVNAALVAFVVVSALWIVNLRIGPSPKGLIAGATLAFVPFGLAILTPIWFLIRAATHGRLRWRVLTVLAVTIVVPLAIVTVYCGPTACFAPGPPHYLMGWFLIGGVALIALFHHLVLNRYPMEADDA